MGALPLAFLAVWVLVGLALFLVALFGGPSRARERLLQSQTRRGRRVTGAVLVAVLVGMGIVVPALVVANSGHKDRAGAAQVRLTDAQERGRALFGRTCNQCHTLAAANTVGQVGPNLDKIKPNQALVLDAIVHGRDRGKGRMPAQLLQGRDAQDVASFVAAVAGRQ
ncbi:MAG TPA: cytochrome c [Solirubrobacteraceae bacterium]|jgi:mono/diheme cytochrome c family protein|nr:cytochrome c [Solirubrobacteraceae bacterium]